MIIGLQDLHAQLTLFEPRVASMREIADQVFAQSTMTDTSSQLRSKLTLLSDRSASLLKICTRYKQLLGETLKSRGESVLPPSSPSPSSKGLSPSPVRSPRRSPHRSTGVLSSEVRLIHFLLSNQNLPPIFDLVKYLFHLVTISFLLDSCNFISNLC